MAILDFLKRTVTSKTVNQALYEYKLHSGQANVMPDNAEAYLTDGYGNVTVYSIISRIDAMRKQARLRLMKDGKEVDDHELLRFTKKINNHTKTDDYITACLIYRLIVGENFTYKPALKTGPDKGKVPELHVLPAAEVEIIEGTIFNPVSGYRIDGNMNVTFPPEDVHHSKIFNPNWHSERNLHGLSPLRAAAKTVSKMNEAELTELKQLENQSPPYILFKKIQANDTHNRLTEPQRLELIEKIKAASGKTTRGLPYIAKDEMGKLDLGSNLVDMALKELTSEGVLALCSVYGLPAELFGYGQKTYNNMGTARKAAWTDCIMPNLDVITQTLNSCTIEGTPYEPEGYAWDFDYSEVEELQEGLKEMVEWMKQAGWTKNEIRKATGKARIENPLMDQPIINMGESFLSDYEIDLGGEKDYTDYLKL